jgi:hypothetical protein
MRHGRKSTETAKPRKRIWLRYSLRACLLFVTVLCVAIGYWAHRANEQRKAVAWVKAQGGFVHYDFQLGDNVGRSAPPFVPSWLCDTLGVDYFARVVQVTIFQPVDEVEPLASLPHIESLCLPYARDVSQIDALRGMSRLEVLELGSSRLVDISALRKLSSLRILALDCPAATDISPVADLPELSHLSIQCRPVPSLAPLRKSTSIEYLILQGTDLDDSNPVPALPHLTYLSLSDTRIRDLASLSALTNLDSLELENTPVDDIGPLAKLRRLRVLKLSSTQVHDITPLRHVKNLEYLELRDTLVNRDQITELQRLLPGCDIRWSQLGAGATPANVAPTAGQVATP